ncbi:MAG: phosphoglycerate mutase family protein [Clostridia bacterium]|nr:phosphoglycerate mutase family protein [Clostridia bacterium]
MYIFIARHGETKFNKYMQRTNGRWKILFLMMNPVILFKNFLKIHDHFDSELTICGRKRVIETKQYLENQGISFDYVISSPSTRAKQTAELLAGRIDVIDCRFMEEMSNRYYSTKRIEEFICDMKKKIKNNILIVSHANSIYKFAVNHGYRGGGIRNCEILCFEIKNGELIYKENIYIK